MVEPGQYFMMGDNRAELLRQPVPSAGHRSRAGTIIGRAFVIVWPFGDAGGLPIPAYERRAPDDTAGGPGDGAGRRGADDQR